MNKYGIRLKQHDRACFAFRQVTQICSGRRIYFKIKKKYIIDTATNTMRQNMNTICCDIKQ